MSRHALVDRIVHLQKLLTGTNEKMCSHSLLFQHTVRTRLTVFLCVTLAELTHKVEALREGNANQAKHNASLRERLNHVPMSHIPPHPTDLIRTL